MDVSRIKIVIIGLEYAGLSSVRLSATQYFTIGLYQNALRVAALQKKQEAITAWEKKMQSLLFVPSSPLYTIHIEEIRDYNVHIVAVPAPVDRDNRPDLIPLIEASRTVGRGITAGNVVIYESPVHPGAPEEECLPVVEQVSGLQLNQNFYAGYSPERINSGDKEHTVEKITKVISGSTPEAAEFIDTLYNSVLKNGTYKAPCVKVVEAAKIVENAQKDVNIAFMKERAKTFDAMGIDSHQILAAAATKWNFLPFHPGLVGGHCIGVDSYSLIEKAQRTGYQPRLLMEAGAVNNSMGEYYATELIRQMILAGISVKDARILILGFAFKPNCADFRNTKVVDIYNTLNTYNVAQIVVCDPFVSREEVYAMYGIEVETSLSSPLEEHDVVFLIVAHHSFLCLFLSCPKRRDVSLLI